MMTIRQIERLWTAKSYNKLIDELLATRTEGIFRDGMSGSPTILAAAVTMVRLDELNQADATIFGVLLRTVLAAQEVDGGWGEPLTTAWCLRALSVGRGSGEAIHRGMGYLAALQQDCGIWPAIPIRRMPADPYLSACVLFLLGDNPEFHRRVRVEAAVNWFISQAAISSPHAGARMSCAGGGVPSMLDEASRAIWNRARLRCRVSGLGHSQCELSHESEMFEWARDIGPREMAVNPAKLKLAGGWNTQMT